MSETLPLGLFHELSLRTDDLAASVAFWCGQGWTPAEVRPVWRHPYAALSYGGLVIGLHQRRSPSPSITFVHEQFPRALEEHREAGMVLAFARTGPDHFKELGFRDPAGHMVTLLEAATHDASSATGGAFFSLPSPDPALSLRFWALLGALPDGPAPEAWPCARRVAGGLPLAIHDEADFGHAAIVRTVFGPVAQETRLHSPEGLAWVTIAR